jgi:C-terminal processing protease CtpA/Prc
LVKKVNQNRLTFTITYAILYVTLTIKAFKEALMKYMKTMAVAMVLLAGQAQAQDNPIVTTVDSMKDKAVNNKVTEFVVNEYNDIKQYQVDSWQQGKDQLARNKEQIVGIFANVKDAFSHYFVKEN